MSVSSKALHYLTTAELWEVYNDKTNRLRLRRQAFRIIQDREAC